MSLKPQPIQPVPEETARSAQSAFPKGSPYMRLRDELGTIFEDEDFIDLFPERGQSAFWPWRLALVTVLQFRENCQGRCKSGPPGRRDCVPPELIFGC